MGLYVGYEVKCASDKFKIKVEETLTGKVILFNIVTVSILIWICVYTKDCFSIHEWFNKIVNI